MQPTTRQKRPTVDLGYYAGPKLIRFDPFPGETLEARVHRIARGLRDHRHPDPIGAVRLPHDPPGSLAA